MNATQGQRLGNSIFSLDIYNDLLRITILLLVINSYNNQKKLQIKCEVDKYFIISEKSMSFHKIVKDISRI